MSVPMAPSLSNGFQTAVRIQWLLAKSLYPVKSTHKNILDFFNEKQHYIDGLVEAINTMVLWC